MFTLGPPYRDTHTPVVTISRNCRKVDNNTLLSTIIFLSLSISIYGRVRKLCARVPQVGKTDHTSDAQLYVILGGTIGGIEVREAIHKFIHNFFYQK